ncbi:hypothetical protein AA0112_g11032 [Alternaria arborescens]|nr:hypothetical protein AA0112_g11032 [Alternaria arborescens]
MMGKIYSRAQKVLVWLGRSTPLIAELLHDMHSLKIDENLKLVWKAIDDHEWEHKRLGLEELCKIEYWERLWVVQEYLLAKGVDMWCGTDSVDPQKIKWLVYVVFKTPHLAESCTMQLLQGRKVRNVRAEQLSLKRHLDEFGIKMKCADVRDRAYGLLALINEKEREKLNIRPNYTLSPLDLLRELMYALSHSGSYSPDELLGYVDTLRLALGLTSIPEDPIWSVLRDQLLYIKWVVRRNQSA